MGIQPFVEGRHDDADIVIIGAGPAGLSIALEFEGSPVRVCVIESGDREADPDVERLSDIESVGLRRAPQDVTRRRGIGGTSAIWSGRCGVFDAMDYQARPWIAHSGWPIDDQDVAPYLDRAGRCLGLGPSLYAERDVASFRRPRDGKGWRTDLVLPVIWQFSQHGSATAAPVRSFASEGVAGAEHIGALQHAGAPKPRHFGEAFARSIAASENIQLLTQATALSIETNEAGSQARSVRVGTIQGGRGSVTGRFVVLACGGIDNARLLLCSRTVNPAGLGNGRDLVGRFLSDHPFGTIATYRGRGSEALRRRLGHRWLERQGARHVYALGLRLAPELQRREGLLNCAVHIVERGDRRSPVARMGSAARLLRQGTIGPELASEVIGALGDPVRLMTGTYDRYVTRQPSLETPDQVDFGCVVEQLPDPDSRVTLSDQTDSLGMPRAKIDWRAADREFETARRMAELLKGEIDRLGFEPPEFSSWLHRDPDVFRSLIHDMAHPMGSTRMSADPSGGVVDADCKVHGVDGLFVAGGSVFTTSGYMNPTLMIVALSLRLADHLKGLVASPSPATVPGEAGAGPDRPAAEVASRPRQRCRVGLVGAGDRMGRIYAPILEALHDRVEVVGIASRPGDRLRQRASELRVDAFSEAATLVAEKAPDFLLVAIASTRIEAALPGLLAIGTPLLVETPLAWNPRAGRRVLAQIRRNQRMVGVAEQTPFLPDEQLKRRLIELGLIGPVTTAQNAFAVYDYHGIAALRAYMGGARRPVRVNATRHSPPACHGDAGQDIYATVTYDDGSVLLHHYGDASAGSPLRLDRGLRAYGAAGTIGDAAITLLQADGSCVTRPFARHVIDGRLQAISVDTPIGPVTWHNPFRDYEFSDEQIAVATLLTDMASAVQCRSAPAYSAERAIEDMEVLAAIRLSSLRSGRPVDLPLSTRDYLLHAGILPRITALAGKASGIVSRGLGRLRR